MIREENAEKEPTEKPVFSEEQGKQDQYRETIE